MPKTPRGSFGLLRKNPAFTTISTTPRSQHSSFPTPQPLHHAAVDPLRQSPYNASFQSTEHLERSTETDMKTNRTFILLVGPAALVIGWLVFGDNLLTTPADAGKTGSASADRQLQQAAKSIAAAATDRIAAAESDDEALQRAHMSLEALELVAALGDVDTTPQADELFQSLEAGAHRGIVDPLIQTRLATAIRQWNQLNDAQHSVALHQFVAAIKKTKLTPGQAE